jgi:hypothetical protein
MAYIYKLILLFMNTALSTILNKLIKEKVITAEMLTIILNQSKDSIYRRLRGDTDFLLNEAFILADKLEISIDALHKENVGQKIFKTKQFVVKDNAVDTATSYINELYLDMKKLNDIGIVNMYYAAKDLPLFCFFSSPVLTSFKLYFWYITLFDNQTKQKPYTSNWLPKAVLNQADDLYKMYNQTNSVEIWNFETINSTLHQILYCQEIGIIQNQHALELLDALQEFITKKDAYAAVEKKDQIGKLTMYLNEILLLDNSVIFDIGFQQLFYLPYQTLNFLSTTDAEFAEQNLQWFQKQIAKSTIISGEAQKDRTKLMNHYYKEIARYRSKMIED